MAFLDALLEPVVGKPNLATLAALIGALYVGNLAYSFVTTVILPALAPSSKLKKYAGKDVYAVVTGASDGIGKEFALQLARGPGKFNLVLMARTQSKLDAVAEEARKLGGVETIVIPFDFANATEADYAKVKQRLDALHVGVLVNNVGRSHDVPTPFEQETDKLIHDIVEINCNSVMKMTRIVVPQMIARKNGLILNIGSLAGLAPVGFLSVYSGSKSFLRFWSQSIGSELKSQGVHVEHLTAAFVQTAMSKIRKSSWLVPTPRDWVKSVLGGVGNRLERVPYWSHSLVAWVYIHFFDEDGRREKSTQNVRVIMKRALKKAKRES
ncbi:Inactive hydroxysteroid dehydrogenase-like protein 1 [Quaeritorhiza haematococci]|nr:Inactive hydroxysteroid dehydrogenase-like protein 1 [Quaeritorhiza haematococci]